MNNALTPFFMSPLGGRLEHGTTADSKCHEAGAYRNSLGLRLYPPIQKFTFARVLLSALTAAPSPPIQPSKSSWECRYYRIRRILKDCYSARAKSLGKVIDIICDSGGMDGCWKYPQWGHTRPIVYALEPRGVSGRFQRFFLNKQVYSTSSLL